MSVIDEILKANERYAHEFTDGTMPKPPSRKLAIVACMDARMDIPQMLGLKRGEAHIIRNAGGILTEDALRSLIISYKLLGTREFMFIHHTDCGMLSFKEEELESSLRKSTGKAAVVPRVFHAFRDPAEDVRLQVEKTKSHVWIPKDITVRGFVYDVKTGRISEVK